MAPFLGLTVLSLEVVGEPRLLFAPERAGLVWILGPPAAVLLLSWPLLYRWEMRRRTRERAR